MNRYFIACSTLLLALSGNFAETRCIAADHYRAELTSAGVLLGGQMISSEASVGTATLRVEYDESDLENAIIYYEVNAEGLDFDGAQTAALGDDATAVHFHDITTCVSPACIAGDTAGTKHVLNAFGVPREDDADLEIFASEHRIVGRWDRSDANTMTPAPSLTPSQILDPLANGEIHLIIHSRDNPQGAIGGQFVLVPEPSGLTLLIIGLITIVRRLR